MNFRTCFLLFIAIGLFSKVGIAQISPPIHNDSIYKAGMQMPDIYGIDSLGVQNKLYDIKSKVVLFCFWSKDCETCKEEMSVLMQLQNLYKEKGLKIIAFSVDSNYLDLKLFIKQNKIDLQALLVMW